MFARSPASRPGRAVRYMSVRCLRHDSLDSVQASLGEFEPPPSRRLARRGRARCDGCGPEWLGAAGLGVILGIRGFLAVKAGLRGFLDGMPSRAGQGVRTSRLASLRQRGGAYGRLCLGDWKVRFYFGSLRLFLGPEIWVSVFHVTSAFG